MRILLNLTIWVIFLLAQAGFVFAEGQTFVITADVPATINGGIIEEGMIGQGPVRDNVTWDFGNLTFQPAFGIWTSSVGYFVVVNGNVTLSYTDTANPNQVAGYSGHGLGYKATIAFKEVNGSTETDITGWDHVMAIRSMDGEDTFTPAQLHNHALKFYVGIYDGNLAFPYIDGEFAPEPFTNADRPGSYQGTLTITSVAS